MDARRLRLGRPPFIESACNASGHDLILPGRWVVVNFLNFALTPTIPGLCFCGQRRESPPDAQPAKEGRMAARSRPIPVDRFFLSHRGHLSIAPIPGKGSIQLP